MLAWDKHSSLFLLSDIDEGKKFYKIATWSLSLPEISFLNGTYFKEAPGL
jgi:hypothetical protein